MSDLELGHALIRAVAARKADDTNLDAQERLDRLWNEAKARGLDPVELMNRARQSKGSTGETAEDDPSTQETTDAR